MRKTIYFLAILALSLPQMVDGQTPTTQTPKLTSSTHAKKGNKSYSLNKDHKAKKIEKQNSISEANASEASRKSSGSTSINQTPQTTLL